MSEQSILAALSADHVRAHVEHICTQIPSRLAGSENARRMTEYSAESLRGAGVDAVVHTLPGLVSFPDTAERRRPPLRGGAIARRVLGTTNARRSL